MGGKTADALGHLPINFEPRPAPTERCGIVVRGVPLEDLAGEGGRAILRIDRADGTHVEFKLNAGACDAD